MWNTLSTTTAALAARTIKPAVAVFVGAVALHSAAHARSVPGEQIQSHPVDLVVALDVSGSMSGLIQSAKQRLWDVVNELSRAQPRPDLRVAVISYGDPRYGAHGGFVRIDVPLTRDLDAVNEALFGFTTNGGDEYVARVIGRASAELQWSANADALRIMFVAGNESATQDPLLSVDEVTRAARSKGIVVNTIYCARGNGDGAAAGWQQVARQAGGFHASIDQNASAVANLTTPFDDRLSNLSSELNRTYVPFGQAGRARQENQVRQDRNAAKMSEPAAASRAVTKAGKAYRGADWDLVDALESGTELEEVTTESLPQEMQAMSDDERRRYVEEKSRRREAIRTEIEQLAKDRRDFMQREAEKQPPAPAGLADALKEGVRVAAEKKGFRFE